MKSLNGLTLQLVDLRDEIARYERAFRPFPPLSGSVSKPRRSTEPETESGYKHLKFACPSEGQPVQYALDLRDLGLTRVNLSGDPMDWPMADEVFKKKEAFES